MPTTVTSLTARGSYFRARGQRWKWRITINWSTTMCQETTLRACWNGEQTEIASIWHWTLASTTVSAHTLASLQNPPTRIIIYFYRTNIEHQPHNTYNINIMRMSACQNNSVESHCSSCKTIKVFFLQLAQSPSQSNKISVAIAMRIILYLPLLEKKYILYIFQKSFQARTRLAPLTRGQPARSWQTWQCKSTELRTPDGQCRCGINWTAQTPWLPRRTAATTF